MTSVPCEEPTTSVMCLYASKQATRHERPGMFSGRSEPAWSIVLPRKGSLTGPLGYVVNFYEIVRWRSKWLVRACFGRWWMGGISILVPFKLAPPPPVAHLLWQSTLRTRLTRREPRTWSSVGCLCCVCMKEMWLALVSKIKSGKV